MVKEIGWNIDTTYSNLPEMFFSKVKPNPVKSPELIVLNDSLASDLGLDIEKLKEQESIDVFAGNKPIIGETFLAQAYAGHQFGHFTMLGDGRAMLVGEHITPVGNRVDIQLKGSGETPYSRRGDGRAALGPMLREYIISEEMNSLGIPTTRSLAVVTTGEKIYRETPLLGAILTRVAESHLRVGTFQYAASFGSLEDVKALADYTINRHFPSLKKEDSPYLSLLKEVIKSQASLISKWMLVGFIHGVMNTDNMAISGESIDYGPCAFMNSYDPSTVYSSIDRNGRYAYGNQPSIGAWNLARFAETLLPLIHTDEEKSLKLGEEAINNYSNLYKKYWIEGMRLKLGILNEEKEDEALFQELLDLMYKHKADYTNTFVGLTDDSYKRLDCSGLFISEEFKAWNKKWKSRIERQDSSLELSQETMKNNNPKIIPRNHQVENALEAATNKEDYTVFTKLVNALSIPFDYENINEEYMLPPDESNVPYKTFCGT